MIWDGQKWVSAPTPQPGTPAGELEIIRQLIDQNENDDAIEAAERFLQQWPIHPGSEEAMNLAGQAEMNRGNFWNAYNDWFERQVTNYPNGQFFDRALDREFRIAEAFLEGRKRKVWKIFRLSAEEEGLDMLLRIASHAPGTEIAERALMRAADWHFSNENYDDAVDAYDAFVNTNPQSPRRAYAMLQAAKAELLRFQGVRWEDRPLKDARERFTVFAQAYPQAARRENIPAILQEIYLTLAHKSYQTGAFYERTKHPRAAAFYYQKTVEEYPDTQWAAQAQQRIAALGPVRPLREAPPWQERQLADRDRTGRTGGDDSETSTDGPPDGPIETTPPSAGEREGPIRLEELTEKEVGL
jgi:outer membrane protein assembly factor BamD (BamD/ComL family)